MEEILETRQHKSLEDKWKWKVWVFPLPFFSFFSFTHFISGKWEREDSISQTEDISGACKDTVGYSSWWDILFRVCKGSWTQERVFILYSCLLYAMFAMGILSWSFNDLSRDTVLYHGRHKGHPFFMWSEAQKHHTKLIMRHLFVKLMLACHSNFCFV